MDISWKQETLRSGGILSSKKLISRRDVGESLGGLDDRL